MALLFTGLLLAASAAATPPEAPAIRVTAPARARRVCRDVSRVGSRLRSYRCLTEAQWAETERQNAEATRDTQDEASRNIRADVYNGPQPTP